MMLMSQMHTLYAHSNRNLGTSQNCSIKIMIVVGKKDPEMKCITFLFGRTISDAPSKQDHPYSLIIRKLQATNIL